MLKAHTGSALRLSPMTGSVSGPLWISHEALEPFPEADWSDLPVPLVTDFILRVDSLLDGSAGAIELRFMDGPFAVTVHTRPNDVSVQFNCPYDGIQLVRISLDELRGFRRSLVTAGESILKVCEQQDWSSSRIDFLRAAVSRPPPAAQS